MNWHCKTMFVRKCDLNYGFNNRYERQKIRLVFPLMPKGEVARMGQCNFK